MKGKLYIPVLGTWTLKPGCLAFGVHIKVNEMAAKRRFSVTQANFPGRDRN